MRRGGKKEARREMSAVTEEESWKREMPRRSSAQHRSSAHRPKEGGTRQTAKPNAN